MCAPLLLSNYLHLESSSIRVGNRLLKNPMYDLAAFCGGEDFIPVVRAGGVKRQVRTKGSVAHWPSSVSCRFHNVIRC